MTTIPKMTLTAFARKHDLRIEIHERPVPVGHYARFYAVLRGVEITANGILTSTFGNGADRNEAKRNLARALNLKRLVVGAYTPERKEFGPHRFY